MNMRKYFAANEGGGGGDGPSAPKNYKPLTNQQRTDWNKFLDYLGDNKVGGSTDLDKKDQSLGLTYLNKYRALNPKTTVSPELIPNIQYDQYQLRKGASFPTLAPEELDYVRKGLSPAYLSREVSPVDGWLGSLTSKSYYPVAHRGTNTAGSYDFGTDIESYVKSLKDPALQAKYLIKDK